MSLPVAPPENPTELLFQKLQDMPDYGYHRELWNILRTPGVDINAFDDEGDTPLIKAVKKNARTAVRYLCMEQALEINKLNRDGDTAYRLAYHACKIDILETLLWRRDLDQWAGNLYAEFCTWTVGKDNRDRVLEGFRKDPEAARTYFKNKHTPDFYERLRREGSNSF